MEKLEQDNRVLAHLDKKIKEISNSGLSSSLPTLNAATADHYNHSTTSTMRLYGTAGSHTTHHTPGHFHTSTTAITTHPPSYGLGLSLPPPQVGPTLNITLGPSKQQQQNLAYAVSVYPLSFNTISGAANRPSSVSDQIWFKRSNLVEHWCLRLICTNWLSLSFRLGAMSACYVMCPPEKAVDFRRMLKCT